MADYCIDEFFVNDEAVVGRDDSTFESILNNRSVDDLSWWGNNEIIVKIIFHL